VKVEGSVICRTRRTRAYYYKHLTTIPEEVKYPVIDESTGDEIGYLGEDFFSEYGKPGVKIILKGRPWIVSSISGFNVHVKPVSDYTAAIPGWEGEVLPTSWNVAISVGKLRRLIEELWNRGYSIEEIADKLRDACNVEVEDLKAAIKPFVDYLEQGRPMPHDRRIVIEGFGNFIVIHSCYGHGVNRCIARVVGEWIKSKLKADCIVRWDAYRILIMTSPTIELKDIAEILKSISVEEGLNIIWEHVDPYILRHVAMKFEALPRGMYYKSASYLLHLPEIFRDTPVYEEAFRFQLVEHYDFKHFKELIIAIKRGELEVVQLAKSSSPSPLAKPIVELGDLIAINDSRTFMERIMNKIINLICLNCLHAWRILVRDFTDDIKCPKCNSKGISIIKWKRSEIIDALNKMKRGEKLSEEEELLIAYAKMSADLITLYGKKAAIALAVKGVGPLTAYQILAKMHKNLDELIEDLREAMKEYLETRDYWEK